MIYPTSKISNLKFQISNSRQAGVTLLLAILILSSVLAISFSLATIMFIEVRSSGDLLKTEPALYAATGVAEQAFFNLERSVCTASNGNCSYTTNFANNVQMPNTPTILSTTSPIFTVKVKAGSTFDSTLNKYDFCNNNAGSSGCNYGKVVINYITTGSNGGNLYAYLCDLDPTGQTPYTSAPCTVPGTSQNYWKVPADDSTACPGNRQTFLLTDGSGGLQLSSYISCASWAINPARQQQLILTNPGSSGDIYVKITTFAPDGVTGKGLPYVGKTAVSINTQYASVGRKIQVIVPNGGSSGGGSGNNITSSQTVSEGGTATLTCASGNIVSYTSSYGKNCTGGSYTCPVSCGSCTVGSSSCSVTYNNSICGDCASGCAKNGDLSITCSSGPTTGTVVLTKNTIGGDGIFPFTATGDSSLTSAFPTSITTSGDSGSQTFSNVNAGSGYSIVENVPLGWNFTSATCSNGSPASFSVIAGATATCTFTDTKQAGYLHHRTITVNSGQVSGTLSNFPVLVSMTDATLKSSSHGGNVQSDSGTDIVFTSDSAGNNVLPYEQESYDPAAGKIVYWVNITSLSDGTQFYMFYDKAGASDQSNKTAVWDSNYKSVYHFPNGSSLSAADSTGVNNGSVNGPTATPVGQIDGAASFSGSGNNYINAADSTSLDVSSAMTLQLWMNNSNTNTSALILKGLGCSSWAAYAMEIGDVEGTSPAGTANKLNFHFKTANAAGANMLPESGTLSTGVPVFVVGTYDGSKMRLYINGSLDNSTGAGGSAYNSAEQLYLGADSGCSGRGKFTGMIDEVRISNSARSANWIKTEYNNQNSPSSFYSVGSEQ
jgi:hypothetical protein